MLHTLPTSPAAAEALSEARDCIDRLGLGGDLDSADALRTTTRTQLALLVAGVVSARGLMRDHGLTPEFVAGHSVGAFAAAVVAGVLTFEEAIRAVRLRGDLTARACEDGDWGMAAVSGLGLRPVEELVGRIGTADDPLWVANVNSADQIVISGRPARFEVFARAARAAGARYVRQLDVRIASHCPLQDGTAAQLAKVLSDIPGRRQLVSYVSNVGGRCIRADAERVRDDLARSVAAPVQWYDGTRVMGELGARAALEMPPGHVLSRLVSDSVPEIRAISLDEIGVAEAVARARRITPHTSPA